MKKHEPPIVVGHSFNVNREDLWDAITRVERMGEWFFNNIPAFQPRPGFKTGFLVQNEGRDFPHCWEVLEVIPLQKITVNWKYEGYEGECNVSFELVPRDHGTQLIVTVTVLEDFSDGVPEFQRESCLGGWNYFIGQSLHQYLS